MTKENDCNHNSPRPGIPRWNFIKLAAVELLVGCSPQPQLTATSASTPAATPLANPCAWRHPRAGCYAGQRANRRTDAGPLEQSCAGSRRGVGLG